MTLYAFDDAMVAPTPVAEFTLSGSNLYSSTDCQERLRPLVTAPPGDNVRDETEKPETHDCYSIDTSWSIAPSSSALPGELTLRYRGAISRAAQHPGAPVAIDQRQVLRYTDGQYRVINGENPIPAI
jgi:hypothetical protein